MARPITSKQIALLKLMAERGEVLAAWNHQDLIDLRMMKFADYRAAYSATGNLASTSIWSISQFGRDWLINERGGQ
jgi:hypothetical protein